MERRKILLGSGAALATVLAGCSSDETGDESNSGNGNGDDEPLSDDGTNDTDGTNGTNGSDGKADVPGLEPSKLTLDSEKLSIEDVNKDGDEVDVVATTTTTDPETLLADLESIGSEMAPAITDPEAFAAAVDSVTWVVEHDGAKVMSFYVDVQWALAFINDEIDEDELADRILETVDETQ